MLLQPTIEAGPVSGLETKMQLRQLNRMMTAALLLEEVMRRLSQGGLPAVKDGTLLVKGWEAEEVLIFLC